MKISPNLCSWTFDLQGKIYTKEEFSSLNKKSRNSIVEKRLSYLLAVFNILHSQNILLINRIEAKFFGESFNYYFQDSSPSFIIDRIKEDFMKIPPNGKFPFSCTASGETIIKTIHREEEISGIIDISFSLTRTGIDIVNNSDLWCPMDLDDNYQIDVAVLNGLRLEECLKSIKALGAYSYICPDEDEFGEDNLAQYGFRIITFQGDITKRDDFPKGREEEVKPFIWEYINQKS